jgi:hypothetical protein
MGRITPYSPMHEPRKEVSLQTMHEILARHVAKKEQLEARAQVEPTPKAESKPKIEWQEPVKNSDGTGYILSSGLSYTDGKLMGEGWTVAKSFVKDKRRYTAHRVRQEWSYTIGCKDTADEAKALCEESAK